MTDYRDPKVTRTTQTNNTTKWVGIAIAVLVAVVLVAWLMGAFNTAETVPAATGGTSVTTTVPDAAVTPPADDAVVTAPADGAATTAPATGTTAPATGTTAPAVTDPAPTAQ